MSLFTAREWWGVTPGINEDFGGGCVTVGNIDNAADGALKIAIGSFSGLLRLYFPRQAKYCVEDLMLESTLEAPILQLDTGQVLSNSNRIALAVLHPRLVAVYAVSAVGGDKELGSCSDASYFKLSKVFEHVLARPACNFAHGTFGGGYGHEQICVQSMDGVLTVIEQERVVVERQLSKFLLPGPLIYCAKADMFLTFSSRMEIECFKYGSITSVASVGGNGKLTADWSLIVGEEVMSIEVGRLSRAISASSVDILLVCSHTLFMCKENGTIRTQKHIDYVPLCSTTYPSRAQEAGCAEENVLIGTQGGVLLVYHDMQLLWSARLSAPATAITVGTYGGMSGLVCCLGHDGALSLAYLGTDPPTSAVIPEAKELDYEAMDEEHRQLLQVIRDASSDFRDAPKETLALRAQVPAAVESGDGDGFVASLTVRVFVSYTGGSTLENVTLVALCSAPLFLTADTVVLPSLAGGNRTPTIVPFTFRARRAGLPISLRATVVATHSSLEGSPRCTRCDFVLPLPMVSEPVPVLKQSGFKITLETNRVPPPLGLLFEDVMSKQPGIFDAIKASGVNAMSISYYCGLDATILVSKNSARFRVQSSSFEGLWLLSDELVRRLVAYYAQPSQQSQDEEPFAVLYAEPLPLQEYFELIDAVRHIWHRGFMLRRALSLDLTNPCDPNLSFWSLLNPLV